MSRGAVLLALALLAWVAIVAPFVGLKLIGVFALSALALVVLLAAHPR